MDASGDALFPRRYLDEHDKRITELHRCVELARVHAAQTILQTVALFLDAADAHEQAAAAYELAGSNGRARDFQARARRHRRAAADRRAAAAALTSRVPETHDSDDAEPRAAISDGKPLDLLRPLQVGEDYLRVTCGKCPLWQGDTRIYELPPDGELRAVGPWQPVLPLADLVDIGC